MDAFRIHERLIRDYAAFSQGFVDLRDERIRAVVADESARGAQWPAPHIALNPTFEAGGSIDELVASGALHPECSRIFRLEKAPDDAGGRPMTLHRHQRDAVDAAHTGSSYVLTTGTGSGKSLAYIVPIVDAVLREGRRKGVKAIVVYPMNALANSQQEELAKFLSHGYPEGPPVTYARYTGQESEEVRQTILSDPPDILLTNYVMLELVLTRPDERRKLIRAAEGLRFLVLDELHTYRGRQGADVAMLVRRVREACQAHETMQCIGTSATMASGDTVADQRAAVADVASHIFGTDVAPERVISETLVRATADVVASPDDLQAAVRARGHAEADDPSLRRPYAALRNDPLASWIEDTFGVVPEDGTGVLVRRRPRTITSAAADLAELTSEPNDACETAVRATLLAGSRAFDPETGRPLFAFRLHQFLSKGGNVFVTAESPAEREITTRYQVVLPGKPERRLFPLAFCRECGQEYLMVNRKERADGTTTFEARHTLRPADDSDGYLYISADDPWPARPIVEERLPASWLVVTPSGTQVIRSRRGVVPRRMWIGADGVAEEVESDRGTAVAAWIPGQFRFCLHCGVSYEGPRTNEFAKLVTLDREGRSSAMSVISASILGSLRSLPAEELPDEARKLLAFVDNRQDASLQAGHFNDFALIVQMRAAMYRAVTRAGVDGVSVLELGDVVTGELDLVPSDYAWAPDAVIGQHRVRRALRNVVEYRAMRDLQASWRVTLPNLERTGLLIVDYPDVDELAHRDDIWADSHPNLIEAPPGVRNEVVRVLLDEMRRGLAIDSHVLTEDFVRRLQRESRDTLTGLWSVSDNEAAPPLGLAMIGPSTGPAGQRAHFRLSGRGAYGKWLRQRERFGTALSVDDANDVIAALIEKVLEPQGVLVKVTAEGDTGYRLNASVMVLRAGAGEYGVPDPLRRQFGAEQLPRVVPFFRDLYQRAGTHLSGLRAAEHTAQVRSEERESREHQFRDARGLPLLFCSPTMELGVDIRSLNAVAMRNVPPTPANYAQRSGRAGRSGQPAVVVTYCSSGNSHDTYYFERPELMVSGHVQPPRLDLANEDLMRSHVHAVWLGETGQNLGRSMTTIVDTSQPEYPVRAEIVAGLDSPEARGRSRRVAAALFQPLHSALEQTPWWSDTWVADVVDGALDAFDQACQRWRDLYRVVDTELSEAFAMAKDNSAKREDRRDADTRYREARQRMELLLNEADDSGQSDFYTYRYLASEGFLPGYSFPRLPLAAYVPGTQGKEHTWLQRPRFLAVSEFGPGALIYHEGARYQVHRVNLPRQSTGTGEVDVVRTEARICGECGYHHPRSAGTDVCELCRAPLPTVLRDMLQMQTVVTRRRQRISADEEERNRVGFELLTTYRFVPRGRRPGSLTAMAVGADGQAVAELNYGDSAEIRVINLGRKRRRHRELFGFPLDLVQGRWLTEKDFDTSASVDDDEFEASAENIKRQARVVPFVQDRRNVLVIRWAHRVSEELACTLRYALERGIEAKFQLEDSELLSEELPDADDRGRTLFVEAAEGGAGVLRRIQSDESALAGAAAEALRIIHVNPVTGAEDDDACVRGCYRCLLSYGNQAHHERIDRRLAVDILRALADGTTIAYDDIGQDSTPPTWDERDEVDLEPRQAELIRAIRRAGGRVPDRIGTQIEGITVDFVYNTAPIPTVVVLDRPHARADPGPLAFGPWNVVHIGWEDDLDAIVANNRSVFEVENS